MIHVEHLHKSFGNVRAVAGISFDVAAGEVVGLLGPNGAGKTTTMRIITGYLAADGGAVTVNGIPVEDRPTAARRLIGYLPENAPLYGDLEVVEFLRYIARLRGIASADMTRHIGEMIGICGLGAVVGRAVGQLSKGYKQRVGLAAAMIHRPPILILDEPTSGLDPNQIVEIRNLIREIGRERTVMLSTHILQEVEATCSRSLIINNGQMVGHGTLDELANAARGDAVYTLAVRAPRGAVESVAFELCGLDIVSIHEGNGRLRIIIKGDGADDRAEDIFQWAVAHGWRLSELKRETASLEEVFRELTKNDSVEVSKCRSVEEKA